MMKLPTPFLYPGKRLSPENNDKSTAHMTNCFISNAAEDYEHLICRRIRAGGFLKKTYQETS